MLNSAEWITQNRLSSLYNRLGDQSPKKSNYAGDLGEFFPPYFSGNLRTWNLNTHRRAPTEVIIHLILSERQHAKRRPPKSRLSCLSQTAYQGTRSKLTPIYTSNLFEPYLRQILHGKCDLLRPECTQCQRKSQSCPGYRDELELIFRVESVSTFEAKKTGSENDKKGVEVVDERHVDEQPIKAEK